MLRRRFPQIEGPAREDICYATSNRQWAVKELVGQVDLLLVVGSANSSNSLRLVDVARAEGTAAHLVDDVGDIDERWLEELRDGRSHLGRFRAGAPRSRYLRVVPGARRRGQRAGSPSART